MTNDSFERLAAALREAAAENETWRGALLSVANAISEPIPADTRDAVREALEFAIGNGRRDGFWTGPPVVSVHDRLNDLCRAALAALDAAPTEGETLPEWAAVDDFGALIIELQFSTLKVHTYIPDDLDRISKATHIRAALLRREDE